MKCAIAGLYFCVWHGNHIIYTNMYICMYLIYIARHICLFHLYNLSSIYYIYINRCICICLLLFFISYLFSLNPSSCHLYLIYSNLSITYLSSIHNLSYFIYHLSFSHVILSCSYVCNILRHLGSFTSGNIISGFMN